MEKHKIKQLKKLIGNTPLLKIYYEIKGKIDFIYAKAEWFNITGSIKDRPALEMFKSNKLKSGQELVEATSGNMGLSLCALGNLLGHKTTIFMPKTMSTERLALLKNYGANVILCDDFISALKKSKIYAKQNNAFLTQQFENNLNEKSHYKTAKEIIKQMKNNKIAGFVSGVGTGGTLMGIAKKLKQHNKTIKIFALEPKSSPTLKVGKKIGTHLIQGISDDFVPKLYNANYVDKIVDVSNKQAIATAQKLSNQLGLGVGISAGANVFASIKIKKQFKKNIVTILPDDNKKYVSTALFQPCNYNDNINFLNYEIIK